MGTGLSFPTGGKAAGA